MIQRRPQPHEYGAFYEGYIQKIGNGPILQILAEQALSIQSFFNSIPDERWRYRYAPGKWCIAEILQHLIDGERIFSYRALRIGRGDKTSLPGFDENFFARHARTEHRTPASLIAEYEAVRNATMHLFKSFTDEDFDRIGTASDAPISPLAIAYIIAGHELHHLQIIRERYLIPIEGRFPEG